MLEGLMPDLRGNGRRSKFDRRRTFIHRPTLIGPRSLHHSSTHYQFLSLARINLRAAANLPAGDIAVTEHCMREGIKGDLHVRYHFKGLGCPRFS